MGIKAPQDAVFLLCGSEGQGTAALSAFRFGCMTNKGNIWGQWREMTPAGSVRPVSVMQAGFGSFSKIGSRETERLGKGQGWDVPSRGTDLVLQRTDGCYTLNSHHSSLATSLCPLKG